MIQKKLLLLAAFLKYSGELSLSKFLDDKVFAGMKAETLAPDTKAVEGVNADIDAFKKALEVEKAAISALK